MSLQREIFGVLVIKITLILVLKYTFFDAPTVPDDREALQRQLISPNQYIADPEGETTQ